MGSEKSLKFSEGFRDGLPICFGYLSVSFAFGMVACSSGLPLWAPIIMSMTGFTGTGQFVAADLASISASIFEMLITFAVLNARYVLMSMSLSQRLPADMTMLQRLLVAFGNTDEVFAVSMGKRETLTFPYICGVILSSYIGWVSGTILGVVANGIIPASITSAFGILLYAMYIAIIIPAARGSKVVLLLIAISACISCLFRFVPFLSVLSDGWIIIIAGVSAALIGALFFPTKDGAEADYED